MGQGDDVVLIHGLGASQGFWGPRILLPLARLYRVTLFDLRGHGYSDMPATGYSLTDFATDVYHLLDRLHIKKADLIGHSFGGAVALQATVLFPERVRSLVLADTRIRSLHQPSSAQMRSDCVLTKKLEHIGLSIPRDEQEAGLWLLERFASSLQTETLELLQATEPFIPFINKKGKTRSAERLLQLFQTTSAKEEISNSWELTHEKLSHLKQPTLAMCGESMLTKASQLELQHHLGRCHTIVIPEAGHFFPLTHTQLFLQKVISFFDKVQTGEYRENERYLVKIPLEIETAELPPFPVLTVNVSARGLLVDSPCKIPPGTIIQIRILSEDTPPQLLGIARVVRMEEEAHENNFRLGLELFSPDEQLDMTRLCH
jgi:pimeloyl-ACP methyl ester carboxylesterase